MLKMTIKLLIETCPNCEVTLAAVCLVFRFTVLSTVQLASLLVELLQTAHSFYVL